MLDASIRTVALHTAQTDRQTVSSKCPPYMSTPFHFTTITINPHHHDITNAKQACTSHPSTAHVTSKPVQNNSPSSPSLRHDVHQASPHRPHSGTRAPSEAGFRRRSNRYEPTPLHSHLSRNHELHHTPQRRLGKKQAGGGQLARKGKEKTCFSGQRQKGRNMDDDEFFLLWKGGRKSKSLDFLSWEIVPVVSPCFACLAGKRF